MAQEIDFTLDDARGGRKPTRSSIVWEVIRPLKVPDDLSLLESALPAPRQTLTQIRHSHHQLARLISQGLPQQECSLITGYSPAYISTIKGDPTFQELVSYYGTQEEQIFVDVVERMRTLGLSSMEELQDRLDADPGSYSNRELMELTEMTIVKPLVAARGAVTAATGVGTGGVSVSVNFIKSPEPSEASSKPSDIIDITPTEED